MSTAKEGWLLKQGAVNPAWKKRFFKLSTDSLSYHKTKGAPELGTIHLGGASFKTRKDGTKNIIEILTQQRTFKLSSEDEASQLEWLACFKKVAEIAEPLPLGSASVHDDVDSSASSTAGSSEAGTPAKKAAVVKKKSVVAAAAATTPRGSVTASPRVGSITAGSTTPRGSTSGSARKLSANLSRGESGSSLARGDSAGSLKAKPKSGADAKKAKLAKEAGSGSAVVGADDAAEEETMRALNTAKRAEEARLSAERAKFAERPKSAEQPKSEPMSQRARSPSPPRGSLRKTSLLRLLCCCMPSEPTRQAELKESLLP